MLSTGSTAMSGLAQVASDQQNVQNQALNMWAERKKAEKEREKTLKGLQDAVAKLDSDIHKNRAKTSMDINKQMQGLLIGG